MANSLFSIYKNEVAATPSWSMVSPSLRLALKNYETIGLLFLIPTLLEILGSSYLNNYIKLTANHHLVIAKLTNHAFIGLILVALWLAMSIVNYAPSIYFRITAVKVKDEAIKVADCYKQGFKVFWRVLFSELFFLVLSTIGLILLIVPGVLIFRRLVMMPYYAAIYPKLSFTELIKLSSSQSKGFMMHIYGTFFVIITVNLLAVYAFGGFLIGNIFITIVTYSVLFMPAMRFSEMNQYYKTHKIK